MSYVIRKVKNDSHSSSVFPLWYDELSISIMNEMSKSPLHRIGLSLIQKLMKNVRMVYLFSIICNFCGQSDVWSICLNNGVIWFGLAILFLHKSKNKCRIYL